MEFAVIVCLKNRVDALYVFVFLVFRLRFLTVPVLEKSAETTVTELVSRWLFVGP
jgi:hypothetical protein